MAKLQLAGRLPEKFYTKMQRNFDLDLSDLERWHIEAGINGAIIEREVWQRDRGGKVRASFEELAAAAEAFARVAKRLLTPLHMVYWTMYLGLEGDPSFRKDLLSTVPEDHLDRLLKELWPKVGDGMNR